MQIGMVHCEIEGKGFLEESHLRVFTQLNDYHILKAGRFGVWSLHAVFLPCIYDGSFRAEIGMKNAKTVLCKADFFFPWSRNVFSACVSALSCYM